MRAPDVGNAGDGFDLSGYHAAGADFAEYRPNGYRGATFFARTPEGAQAGRRGGAGDFTATGDAPNIRPVQLRSRDVAGFRYSDVETAAIKAMPERVTAEQLDAVVNPFLKDHSNFDYWWRIYDEVETAPGVFEYRKKPLPQLNWDDAERTGLDVYGRQWPHWGGEAGAAKRANEAGFRAFAQSDESGLSIGVIDANTDTRPRFGRIPNAPARGDGQFSRAPGIAPQQAPPRTSPRLFPSPNTPRPRPQAPAGTGDMQPEGIAGIRAYHGSPHDFDRFRWDETTRGTGEGAQAYGDGLYFGESEEVARTYRDTLTSRTGGLLDGQPLYSPTGGFRNDVARRIASELGDSGPGAVITLQRHGGDIDATIAEIRARWNQSDPATVQALEGLEALRPRIQRPKGHMYEVDINANPDDFIDLDLPMGQQSPRVRDYVSQVYDMPQGRPFNQLRYRPTAAEAESARKAGLPGYRFLDQGSRGVGSGSRNLVVIDDSLIEILRKYGIAGLTAGGAGAGAMQERQQVQ
jgi:hypothetical protein